MALIGLWTHQVLLDRERLTNLSDDLLEQPAIRRGLADQIVEQVQETRVGRVPGSGPVLRAGIERVLTTEEYRVLFRQALGDAHDQLTSDQSTSRAGRFRAATRCPQAPRCRRSILPTATTYPCCGAPWTSPSASP